MTPPSPLPVDSSTYELDAYDTLTQKLLSLRDIKTRKEADAFFAREYESGLHDPYLLPDMEKAVERILRAIEGKERIAIYSDYDCDGIPGGVVFHDFFALIGYTHFSNYIPHRHTEGYGLNTDALDQLAKEGVSLLITVDCGIQDVTQVAHATLCSMDVIVTDHHEPGEVLPEAYAVINPKRKDSQYPFSDLCGSGIAFKVVTALLKKGNERGLFSVAPGQEKWLLDLVGIATVADMVPLQGENRLFAHYGLAVVRKGRRVGLQHLFRVMKTPLHAVTEDDVGFMIAPRINAASRMGSPQDAFALLATKNEKEAGAYARHLDHINNERKGVVAAMVKEAKRKIALRSTLEGVLVVGDPLWRPSLAGLVANTLAEEYKCPVFVWGRDGKDILKGSCRSGGTGSVFALMQDSSQMFVSYGGHHASGGFVVKEECIHTLEGVLASTHRALSMQGALGQVSQASCADAILTLKEVTPRLLETLAQFAPYGVGNPKPVFLFSRVAPASVEVFGKQKAHTKIVFREGSRTIGAIGFFMLPQAYTVTPCAGEIFDLYAHVEESFFMGRSEIRLRIVSIEEVSSNSEVEEEVRT